MPIDKRAALDDIDRVLAHKGTEDNSNAYDQSMVMLNACVQRWAPAGTSYIRAANVAMERHEQRDFRSNPIEAIRSVLFALRADIDADQMRTFSERVRADLCSDLMAQAEYLNVDGFRRAACVLAGGVLEEHLRLLAARHGLALQTQRGEPVKAAVLNDQLQSAASLYGKAEQAQVSAWQKMRNDAAHGVASFEQTYDTNELRRMVEGIRGFVAKYPA